MLRRSKVLKGQRVVQAANRARDTVEDQTINASISLRFFASKMDLDVI